MPRKGPAQDLSWLRQLASAAPERLKLRGFDLVVFEIPLTSEHHEERYRYRLLAFDPLLSAPVISVDLEHDILGGWCLSTRQGQEYKIVARYDEPPGLADFRDRAIDLAEKHLPARTCLPSSRGPARKRKRI